MVLIDPDDSAADRRFPSGFMGVPAFYIDQKEITVRLYRKVDPEYDEIRFTGQPCPDCPVMGINWGQARNYCLKAGKRLPTEQEWETASGGKTDRDWPWGNRMRSNRANISGDRDGYSGPAPVGSFPNGASPYGVLDMSGNVWEWVDTAYKPVGSATTPSEETTLRIVKGGGWTSPESISKIAFRNVVDPELANPTFGFRCAKSLKTF